MACGRTKEAYKEDIHRYHLVSNNVIDVSDQWCLFLSKAKTTLISAMSDLQKRIYFTLKSVIYIKVKCKGDLQ